MSMFQRTKASKNLRLSFMLLTENNITNEYFSHPHSLVLVDHKYKATAGV